MDYPKFELSTLTDKAKKYQMLSDEPKTLPNGVDLFTISLAGEKFFLFLNPKKEEHRQIYMSVLTLVKDEYFYMGKKDGNYVVRRARHIQEKKEEGDQVKSVWKERAADKNRIVFGEAKVSGKGKDAKIVEINPKPNPETQPKPNPQEQSKEEPSDVPVDIKTCTEVFGLDKVMVTCPHCQESFGLKLNAK